MRVTRVCACHLFCTVRLQDRWSPWRHASSTRLTNQEWTEGTSSMPHPHPAHPLNTAKHLTTLSARQSFCVSLRAVPPPTLVLQAWATTRCGLTHTVTSAPTQLLPWHDRARGGGQAAPRAQPGWRISSSPVKQSGAQLSSPPVLLWWHACMISTPSVGPPHVDLRALSSRYHSGVMCERARVDACMHACMHACMGTLLCCECKHTFVSCKVFFACGKLCAH